MRWQELIKDGFGRVLEEVLEPAMKGLTKEDLDWQPRPDCNSVGWITWHLTRVQDHELCGLSGEEQLWIKGQWHARFNRPPDPEDTGFGHTPEEVAAFRSPGTATLLDYYRAVLERTKQYVDTLTPKALERKLDEAYQPVPTVGVRLVSVLADCLTHAGEVAYLRGLRKGKGWMAY